MAEALLIGRADVVKFTAMNGNVDTDSSLYNGLKLLKIYTYKTT